MNPDPEAPPPQIPTAWWAQQAQYQGKQRVDSEDPGFAEVLEESRYSSTFTYLEFLRALGLETLARWELAENARWIGGIPGRMPPEAQLWTDWTQLAWLDYREALLRNDPDPLRYAASRLQQRRDAFMVAQEGLSDSSMAAWVEPPAPVLSHVDDLPHIPSPPPHEEPDPPSKRRKTGHTSPDADSAPEASGPRVWVGKGRLPRRSHPSSQGVPPPTKSTPPAEPSPPTRGDRVRFVDETLKYTVGSLWSQPPLGEPLNFTVSEAPRFEAYMAREQGGGYRREIIRYGREFMQWADSWGGWNDKESLRTASPQRRQAAVDAYLAAGAPHDPPYAEKTLKVIRTSLNNYLLPYFAERDAQQQHERSPHPQGTFLKLTMPRKKMSPRPPDEPGPSGTGMRP